MNLSYLVLIVGLAIGFLHLKSSPPPRDVAGPASVTWPTEFEGRPLQPLPLSRMEAAFSTSFPGAIAQFQCGDDQVILRRVNRATRKLHSSSTCLRAAGFQVGPTSIEVHHGNSWAVYEVARAGTILRVREQIRSVAPSDPTWTEVSQWFWHATFHPDRGPWIAVTVLRELGSSQ